MEAGQVFLKAVEAGDFALCQVLLDGDQFDPTTVVNSLGLSALHVCAAFSRFAIATILVSRVNATRRGGEAEETLKTWVNRPCSLGLSPLHYAVMNDAHDLACLFLKIGADMNARTPLGMSAMHLAARGDSPLCLAYFRDQGLSWSDPANDGSTPMHEAAREGKLYALLLLLAWDEAKSVLRTQDSQGNTPLHLALISGRRQTAAILLQFGADFQSYNNKGQSGYDLAASSEDASMRSLVKSNSFLVSCGLVTPRSQEGRKWHLVVLAEIVCLSVTGVTVTCSGDLFSIAAIGLFGIGLLQQLLLLLTICTSPYLSSESQLSHFQLYSWNPKPRVCPFCRLVQPPRVIHCPTCTRCILRFDHHCPWVNNCIGAPNLAYFLLLLIVTLCDIGGIGGTAAYALASNQAKTEVCLVANWGIMTSMVPVFMAVGVLLTIQSKNFAANQTTFERFSKRKKTENAVNTPQSCLSNCAIMCSRSESPLQQPLLIHDL